MKKILLLLAVLPGLALAQTYNLFKPANGLLKGATTTYVTTTAAGTDVAAVFTGTCNTTTFLRGDGSCQIPAGSTTGANPSVSVGLTAVNGSAATFLRSDAAPALSQSIVPTWTGLHTYSAADVQVAYSETDQAADLKNWLWDINGGIVQFGTATDAAPTTLVNPAIKITRGTTTALTNMTFGYSVNGTYTFPFTSTATFSGAVSAARFNFSSGVSASGDSIYSPSGGQIGFSTSGTQRILVTSNVTLTTALVSGGTTFTVSGCSNSAHAGGAVAGTVTLGANSCSLVVTPGQTAPTGWTCQAHDRNAPTVLIGGESSSNATTATFTIPVTAGTTDVISFSCVGF